MKPIRVGLVGSGFVAELHMHAYHRVYGAAVAVTAVVSRGDAVLAFARKHKIPTVYRNFPDLLKDQDIDVIIATGTHRGQTPAEDILVLGETMVKRWLKNG